MKNELYKKTIINSAFSTKKVDFKDIVKLKLNSNEFAELLEQFLNNDVEIMIDNELMVIEDESFYSDDSLKMFINEINTFKRLTKEEEQVLLKLYKKGDKVAKKKLIESNMRLVVYIAKLFYKKSKIYVELLDLIQEGSEGLIEGIERFDITRKNRFSTYVVWWISQKIRVYTSNSVKRLIKMPRKKREILYKIKTFETSYFENNGIYPNNDEISASMGIDKEKLEQILSNDYVINSLDVPIDEKDNTLIETITSEKLEYEEIDNRIDFEILIKQISQILTERELKIILLRNGYIDGENYTLEAIADFYNLSRERIRQIEQKAYKKIRNYYSHQNEIEKTKIKK